MRIDYDLSQVEGVAKALTAARKDAARVLEAAMWRAELLIEREVKERTPVTAGSLRASIAAREPAVGVDGIVGLVGTPLKYAAPVEDGSRLHFPPLQPLADWAVAKLGVPAGQARGVAYAIARKIAAEGTEGAGMFAQGFEAAESQVERIFEVAAARLARTLGEPA